MVSQPIALDKGRAYVIGDIHGCSALLDRMVDLITQAWRFGNEAKPSELACGAALCVALLEFAHLLNL